MSVGSNKRFSDIRNDISVNSDQFIGLFIKIGEEGCLYYCCYLMATAHLKPEFMNKVGEHV